MASDSAPSTAEHVTDTPGSSVQIVQTWRARQPPRAADFPHAHRRTPHRSCPTAPRLVVVRTALRLLRSMTQSLCRARTSARHTGSHHPMMKRQPKPGWTRLLPHRRWRTSAWHASAPRSAVPARRMLRRLRRPCRHRLDSWDPSLRSRSPSPHLYFLKKFLSIFVTLITLLVMPPAHPTPCTLSSRSASRCALGRSRCSLPCSAQEIAGPPRPHARSSTSCSSGMTPSWTLRTNVKRWPTSALPRTSSRSTRTSDATWRRRSTSSTWTSPRRRRTRPTYSTPEDLIDSEPPMEVTQKKKPQLSSSR